MPELTRGPGATSYGRAPRTRPRLASVRLASTTSRSSGSGRRADHRPSGCPPSLDPTSRLGAGAASTMTDGRHGKSLTRPTVTRRRAVPRSIRPCDDPTSYVPSPAVPRRRLDWWTCGQQARAALPLQRDLRREQALNAPTRAGCCRRGRGSAAPTCRLRPGRAALHRRLADGRGVAAPGSYAPQRSAHGRGRRTRQGQGARRLVVAAAMATRSGTRSPLKARQVRAWWTAVGCGRRAPEPVPSW